MVKEIDYLKPIDIFDLLDIPDGLRPSGPNFKGRTRSKGLLGGQSAFEPPLGLRPSRSTYKSGLTRQSTDDVGPEDNSPRDAGLSEKAVLQSFTLRLPPSSTIQTATFYQEDSYLQVSFRSGSTYGYTEVPINVIMNWMRASSAGSFFYYNIRTSFSYSKV